MKKCIILANGEPPRKEVINFLRKKGYEYLICADGGANAAFRMKLIPDIVIGDLDSITLHVKEYYKSLCKIVELKRQNDTDVEKALKYAAKNYFTDIILLAVTGDRLDHSFCNLGIALKFYRKFRLRILHHSSILETFTGDVELKARNGEMISIYGFDEKTKITSNGLKYKLNKTSLPFGKRESTSNVAVKDVVSLKIIGGKVFVIRDFDTLRKNDLF